MCSRRGGDYEDEHSRRLKTQLLIQMDGAASYPHDQAKAVGFTSHLSSHIFENVLAVL